MNDSPPSEPERRERRACPRPLLILLLVAGIADLLLLLTDMQTPRESAIVGIVSLVSGLVFWVLGDHQVSMSHSAEKECAAMNDPKIPGRRSCWPLLRRAFSY